MKKQKLLVLPIILLLSFSSFSLFGGKAMNLLSPKHICAELVLIVDVLKLVQIQV